MLRLTQFAAVALFATALLSLTAPSARAFTQENLRAGGDGNSTFADPDDQVSNFGGGVQPLGPNGPVVQFGAQQGPLTQGPFNPFGFFQGSGPQPPDPYARPLGNGN